MSIDVALSTRRGVGRDTYSLPQKNAATPQVARQWVRPRSSAMSIDVALSTRRGVGRDTYSLPKKPYLCIVFFIVLDLRLTRLGYSGIPFFLPLLD